MKKLTPQKTKVPQLFRERFLYDLQNFGQSTHFVNLFSCNNLMGKSCYCYFVNRLTSYFSKTNANLLAAQLVYA